MSPGWRAGEDLALSRRGGGAIAATPTVPRDQERGAQVQLQEPPSPHQNWQEPWPSPAFGGSDEIPAITGPSPEALPSFDF